MALGAFGKLLSRSLSRSASSRKLRLERSSSNSSSSSGSSSSSWECCYDSDEENDTLGVPLDVPKGCMAVYVGSVEKRRFIVGTHLLSNPVFQVLLQRAADEYGYGNAGALTIPCEAVLFEHFLWLLNNNDPAAALVEVDELLNFYSS